eukprot:11191907-Lingulodinium_polyedra.AAC.1
MSSHWPGPHCFWVEFWQPDSFQPKAGGSMIFAWDILATKNIPPRAKGALHLFSPDCFGHRRSSGRGP